MARRPEPESDPYTRAELNELRDNLAKLSGQSVMDFYRDSHRECALERKPSAKAIQRLVTAWRILNQMELEVSHQPSPARSRSSTWVAWVEMVGQSLCIRGLLVGFPAHGASQLLA